MTGESADDYRYSSESTGRISFNHRTTYSEQEHESETHILHADSYQPPESGSELENAIELADHPGPQSSFSNTQHELPLDSSRSQLIPGMFDRLGLQIIITNIGAVVLMALAVSALSFLWFCSEESKHWRRVMVDGWIGQAVTLSTLAIRLSVSVQAGTAVAMLASVSLESRSLGGVLLPEAPALSIARYVNTGPIGSLLYFGKSSQWSFNFSIISISVLAATTFASQFTSTLLLWDVRPSVVRGFPRQITTGIGFSMDRFASARFDYSLSKSQNYWLAPPQSYPTFAEWALSPSNSPESVIDTGPSIRAFLPIPSEADRSTLLEFQGMASAFDARVICLRPTIQNWSFIGYQDHANISHAGGYSTDPISFNGTLFLPRFTAELADVLRHDFPSTGYPFKVQIDNMVVSDPTFMVHGLPRRTGGLINVLDPMQNSTLDYSYRTYLDVPNEDDWKSWYAQKKEHDERWGVELGHSFLLISAGLRGKIADESGTLFNIPRNTTNTDFKVEERGPWLDFSRDSDPDYREGVMSVTMCYDALRHNHQGRIKGLQDFLVSAKRKSNYNEPKLGWDSKNGRFETMSIRAQLDAPRAASDRLAFAIDPEYLNKTLRSFQWNVADEFAISEAGYFFIWRYDKNSYYANPTPMDVAKKDNAPSETYDFLTDVVWKPLKLEGNNDTFEIFATCHDCRKISGDDVPGVVRTDLNPVLNTMFVDIMRETDNPALAWQALVTTLMRTAYYDWLPTFDYMGNSTVTSMVPCQKPQYRKGFLLVMANLLVHLVFVAGSSFLFFTRTRYSLLSNAWQAIAQIKAPETELYLENATTVNDKKVKREIDRKGARRRFNISRNNEDGRVCLL